MKRLNILDMALNQIKNVLLDLVSGNPSTPPAGQLWMDTTAASSEGRVKFKGAASVHTLVTDGGDLSAGSVANAALTTNPLARANHTGTQLAATISDFATTAQAYRLDQFAAPTAAVAFGSQRLTGVATPTSGTDAANRQYVDDTVAGLSWKDEVRVATTANGSISTAFVNGQVIDGITLATGDRILIKDQTTQSDNGIYVVPASGAPTRSGDANIGTELIGSAVYVANGTANAGTRWVNNNTGTITIGSSNVTFASFGGGSSYTNGNGLSLTGSTFAVVADTGISVTGSGVAVDGTVVVKKFAANIGDGATTAIAVTHSLGTKDIVFAVRTVADDTFVECDVTATSTTVATFTFAVAPTTNQYRVIIKA